MALYDNYLNQNNLYSRPSEMMSNVNDYLGANRASLPMNADSLGSMMNRDMGDLDGRPLKDIDINGNGDDGGGEEPAGPTRGGSGSLLSKFIGDLGSLDENQQGLLLDFITGGGKHGDSASGVSAEEYAQLFNVSDEYSGRFQGFPQLTNISKDISNVFAYGDQQRGFEQSSAQQAMAAASRQGESSGRGFSGFGASARTNALNRRGMMDTLRQRQSTIDESVANRYGSLLSSLQSALRSGFSTAGQILQENPGASFASESNFRVGETRPAGDDLEYWDGSSWVDRETYMRTGQD